MIFLIGVVLMLIIYGFIWFLAFQWAKRGVPASKVYASDPQKQSQLLQTPIAGIWRALLYTPLRWLTAITVVGPLVFFFGTMPVIKGMVWPTAPGTVTTSQVVPNAESTGYNLALEYQFTAGGKAYKGRQIGFDNSTSQSTTLSQSAATALQQKYPKDSSVTVHYDPQLPLNSVLDTQLGQGTLTWFAVAAIFTLIGTLFFALYLRARNWKRLYFDVNAMQARGNSSSVPSPA